MNKTKTFDKTKLWKAASVVLALVLWQIAASAVGTEMLLASPVKVIARLATIWREDGFFPTVLFSLLRISAGFLLAFVLGTVFGIAAGRFRVLEYLLWPYVVTVKTVPIASFIILCLIWLNYNELTILIAFLIAFPAIYSNVLQGIRSTDAKKKELASLYRIPWTRQLLYIYLPAVKPYLISASAVAIGMAWKAGVAAEVIGIIDGSIGEMLYQAKVYFQNADLLCWTVVIILASVITEKLFVLLLKAAFKGVEKL